MIIPVLEAGQHGFIADRPADKLPLNAWTDGRNVRFRDGVVEKLSGHGELIGTPLYSPQWLYPTAQGGTALWLYLSLAKAGATDGVNHTDTTRASADYTATPSVGWTGTSIEDIPVVNNGIDLPQMWNKPSLSQPLADLPFWPPTMRANSLRSLKRYLVAFDVTKDGVRYPNMIKWSHQAPTGGVPQTWDESLETNDAGEWVLPAEGGFIVDAFPLRDSLMIYKEFQTWQMDYVAGQFIFRFIRKFQNVGTPTRRCVQEFFAGQHLVYTGDDVVLHDGHQPKSLVDSRIKRMLSKAVDATRYNLSFVATDHTNREVLVCVPEPGGEGCTLAFIWSWLTNSWGVRELPSVFYAEAGMLNPDAAGDTWDTDTEVWDTDTEAWGDRISDPTKRRLVMASSSGAGKLYTPGITQQFAGADYTAYVERTGLGVPTGRDQSGQYPPDFTNNKQVLSVWPHVSGTIGGVITVELGLQSRINTPVEWVMERAYKIGTDDMLDFSGSPSSRIHALRFKSEDQTLWKLSGYDIEAINRGKG